MLIKGESVSAFAEFTIDTGYSGTLALPLADCVTLGLTRIGERDSFLADGSTIVLEMYRLGIVWDGNERDFEVLTVGEERLLGAQVLNGYELCLNYESNTLTIKEPVPLSGL